MLAGRAPQLSTVREGLPPAWDEILVKLLEPQPEDRHPSARELLREIDARRAAARRRRWISTCARRIPGGDPLAGILVGRQAERESAAPRSSAWPRARWRAR